MIILAPYGPLDHHTQVSILNANYCLKRLEDSYRAEFRGRNGYVAHEFIMDCRSFKKKAGITVNDVAKRMMDYGCVLMRRSWEKGELGIVACGTSEIKINFSKNTK